MIKFKNELIKYRGEFLRSQRHISLGQMSGETGIEEGRLFQFEYLKLKPDSRELMEICRFFNLSASYLMGANDIVGEFDEGIESEEVKEKIIKRAEDAGIDMNSYTDEKLGITDICIKELLNKDRMSFEEVYSLAIILDTSIDYLIGTSMYVNWCEWEKEKYPLFYEEKKADKKIFTDREYYIKSSLNSEHTEEEIGRCRFKELKNQYKNDLKFYAKIADASVTSIYKWENGTPISKMDSLVKLAEYFNVSCAYFLGLTDVRAKNSIYTVNLNLAGKIEESSLSVSEFKKRANMQSGMLKKYTSDNPPAYVRTYVIMAEALGVSIDYLLGLTSYKTWETDYMRAKKPQFWVKENSAFYIYREGEFLTTAICTDREGFKCITGEGEIVNLDSDYIADKEFIELKPVV